MKRILTAAGFAFVAASGSALAADLPSRKSPPPAYVPAPVFANSWTGWYAGVNAGSSFFTSNNNASLSGGVGALGSALKSPFGGSGGGFTGGAQIGYNHQLSPLFVVGFETDLQGSTLGGSRNAPGIDWFGTVRGRLGLSVWDSRILIYGTGGFAYGEAHNPPFIDDGAKGWTAGGGIEYMINKNWSAKLEYLYTDLSVPSHLSAGWINPNPQIAPSNHLKTQNIRVGLNYRVNLWNALPIVAKY